MKGQRCQLCGGPLEEDTRTRLMCHACGAGNRALAEIEGRGAELAHDAYVEERIATEPGEWYEVPFYE